MGARRLLYQVAFRECNLVVCRVFPNAPSGAWSWGYNSSPKA